MSTTDYLSALNYGTSAETNSTLGTDRLDYVVPADQYHASGLQISRMKNLLIAITEDSAGGTRLKLPTGTSNRFSVGEYGLQMHASYLQVVRNGATAEQVPSAALTTKGDIIGYTGSAFSRLGVGADGTVLTADSGTTSGWKWAVPSASADATAIRGVTVDAGAATPTNLDILIYVAGDTKWHSAAFTNFAGSSIQSVGTSNSAGSSADFARGNHVHSIGVGAINDRTMAAAGLWTANEIATSGTFGWSGAHTFTAAGSAITVDNNFIIGGTIKSKTNVTLALTSQQANGASPQFTLDTLNAVTGANPLLRIATAGVKVMELQAQSSTHYLQFYDSAGGAQAALVFNNTPGISVYNTTYLNPYADNTIALGGASNRWASVWAANHYGIEQTAATSGAVTITPTSGETIQITATGNVTSLAIGDGSPGQRIALILRQNGGGTATWPSVISNVRLAGGSFTKTTTASAIDAFWLAWDNALTDWVELTRATNLS